MDMEQITPAKVAMICNGIYYGDKSVKDTEVSSITTDSRDITGGGLFVAIKGARTDGNKYIMQTYNNGAVCCISELTPQEALGSTDVLPAGCVFIQVKSCYQALKDIAGFYRITCGTKIIGITGSVGKTSTKEMVASVLSRHFNTLKTQGNFNNEVGVPLTLFRLRKEHEVAVVEMGISGFGEMTRLSQIVKPDICIITNIGQCHLENLGDRDGVLKAKTEIFTSMAKDGMVYLNGDDDKLAQIKEVNGRKPVFFGTGAGCDVYAENIKTNGIYGTESTICFTHGDGTREKIEVSFNLPGRHMVYNAMAAIAVGSLFDMDSEDMKRGIEAIKSVGSRLNIVETGKFTVIDDCYNANPVSMKSSIDVLESADTRKVAVLGDMFELGADEKKLHYEVGTYLGEKKIDTAFLVGALSENIYQGLKDSSKYI